jgi:hypothetical protein
MPTTIVLIRREGQPIELLPSPAATDSTRIAAELAPDDLGQVTAAHMIYTIELPDDVDIRPADWRRIAYDHDAIGQLLGATMWHNCRPYDFEPLTPELLKRIEAAQRIAMRDLATVFDVDSVECAATPDGLLEVTVSGQHKNGTHASRTIQYNPGA